MAKTVIIFNFGLNKKIGIIEKAQVTIKELALFSL
jgi:hypothetical protein